MDLNLFDVIAVLVLVLAVLAGIRTGALPQIGGIGGALTGLLITLNGATWLLDVTKGLEPIPRALVVLGVILGAVILGEALGSAIGRRLAERLGEGVLSGMDRVAGGVLGAAQALLIIWLAGGLMAVSPFPRLAQTAATSTAVRTVETYLPPPVEIIGQIANALDDSGLPDVFVGLEPIPLAPVDTPSSREALRIAGDAVGSTARVVTRACESQVTGTAFLVAKGYLVTNAHVVAGASTIRLSTGDGVADAIAVMFDPRLDLALLYAPDVSGPVLALAPERPDRGTLAAALGYAGGGPLVVMPAAVTGSYPATGRDIYGTDRVTRDILELRAQVEPGDSGGPLVLEGGTVGGLVFAESKTDPDVGYALTPESVADRVGPSIGSTAEVDLGPCLH
ncbi:MAG TPA: MarP family serine protease [Candidatus Limnocylindrales bacterium]|nr:MarP family serine protease [Candidatus Limnocylindrales bacterium]